MHDKDVATTAKRWSPESVIHDRVFRQNALMCYDILLWVAVHSHSHSLAAWQLGSGGYDEPLKSAKSPFRIDQFFSLLGL